MKTTLRLAFVGLVCIWWLTAGSMRAKAYAYCEEGESGGLYAFFGDCCFFAEIAVQRKCDSINYENACNTADMCDEICHESSYSETHTGYCEYYGVGNGEFAYDANCRCYWDLPAEGR